MKAKVTALYDLGKATQRNMEQKTCYICFGRFVLTFHRPRTTSTQRISEEMETSNKHADGN